MKKYKCACCKTKTECSKYQEFYGDMLCIHCWNKCSYNIIDNPKNFKKWSNKPDLLEDNYVRLLADYIRATILRGTEMRRHIEDNAQMQVVTWFRQLQSYKKIPDSYLLVHNNNSTKGLLTYGQRNNWKKRGGVAGIPDLVLYHGRGMCLALFIEMKSESHRPKKAVDAHWWVDIYPNANGKEVTKYGVTSTQSAVMRNLEMNKYYCEVCYSSDEAIKLIERYLGDMIKK